MKITIKNSKKKRILLGHPWVFEGSILKAEGDIRDGNMVDLVDESGLFLGRGYFNSRSDIRIRILTRNPEEEIDKDFFIRRFSLLRSWKGRFFDPEETNCYRLAFGESDGLPGLIVDQFDDVLILQVHTLGMERLKAAVVDALSALFHPRTIYERSDSPVRERDGLEEPSAGLLCGEDLHEVAVREKGIRFVVDFSKGQKTGFFLDQRENRDAVGKLSKGKRVLDLFCYSGGFGLYAALHGASRVVAVDSSSLALEYARRNFELNRVPPERYALLRGEAGSFLRRLQEEPFDLIVLDPPAFAKNQRSVKRAVRAYTSLNASALGKLPEGGILATSSCSSFVTEEMFSSILYHASVEAGAKIRLLESRAQPLDHAYNFHFPEGRYLKFFVVMKV